MAATVEKEREVVYADGFYHMGLLPAGEETLFPVADRDKAGKVTLKKIDAWKLWNDSEDVLGEKGISIFVAKARQFFGLTAGGFHFASTNEYVQMGKDGASRSSFPGGVSHLTAEQVEAVVKACYRHILRFPNGIAKMDDPAQPVEEIDLDFGKKPEFMTNEEFVKAKNDGKAISASHKFNPKTDRYLADFVYLKKLNIDENDVDFEDYRKNPNKFHIQWIGPVTKKFYTSPPKSISETFKNPGA